MREERELVFYDTGAEFDAIYDYLPRYWKRLEGLEAVLGQMKSKPLSEIGGRR